MRKKPLSPPEKAAHLGKANDYLKKSRDSLGKAGDFGKYCIDPDIVHAYEKISLFIDNACRNLEKF